MVIDEQEPTMIGEDNDSYHFFDLTGLVPGFKYSLKTSNYDHVQLPTSRNFGHAKASVVQVVGLHWIFPPLWHFRLWNSRLALWMVRLVILKARNLTILAQTCLRQFELLEINLRSDTRKISSRFNACVEPRRVHGIPHSTLRQDRNVFTTALASQTTELT